MKIEIHSNGSNHYSDTMDSNSNIFFGAAEETWNVMQVRDAEKLSRYFCDVFLDAQVI
jgi:hypothetical protein